MSSTPWQSPEPVAGPLHRLRAAVDRRIGSWARRRQGLDDASVRLHSGRTYILPTGVGLTFALMTFAMLLGSMNYNNNMSFLLTFTLASVGLIAMHHCQRNLVGLEVSFAGAEPVFAGQSARFRIALNNPSKSTRHQLQVFCGDATSEICDLDPGASEVLYFDVATEQRGILQLDRFGVRTRFPFEMFRAWSWLHMELKCLVYPAPAEQAPAPPPSRSASGHRQHNVGGDDDFAGLRTFNPGDAPRHVAWKAYARSGELLSKQFAGSDVSSQWFDLQRTPGKTLEEQLAVLCRWIVRADRRQEDYALRLGSDEIPPGHGRGQRHHCLRALALFGHA